VRAIRPAVGERAGARLPVGGWCALIGAARVG